MNKVSIAKTITLTLLLPFFIISCSKSEPISGTLVRQMVNKTDKQFIVVIETDVDSKSLVSMGQDSTAVTFVKHSKSESVLFGLASTPAPRIYVEREIVYNLTDTAKFEVHKELDTSPYSEEDKIYSKHLVTGLNEGTHLHEIISVKLYVTDEVVGIMKKDYTMLQKFSEHYK